MNKFAFVSRHPATESQKDLAQAQEIELIEIGDVDAFSVTVSTIDAHGAFDGVVVVHPAAALRLASAFVIGVFENANRAPVGAPPRFEAKRFFLYDLRD